MNMSRSGSAINYILLMGLLAIIGYGNKLEKLNSNQV